MCLTGWDRCQRTSAEGQLAGVRCGPELPEGAGGSQRDGHDYGGLLRYCHPGFRPLKKRGAAPLQSGAAFDIFNHVNTCCTVSLCVQYCMSSRGQICVLVLTFC